MKNLLSNESSPYLRQHMANPVWWWPWGPKALEAAAAEDKPIFLSIGYATCHWCHVMEGDSFEKQDVADILNAHFIAIKVDREERPDVDSIYMAAVQTVSGHGGWPMSVFLTPEGRPFWAGTFIPREKFKAILEEFAQLWRENRPKIIHASLQITDHVADLISPRGTTTHTEELPPQILGDFSTQMLATFDARHGGFGRAPKFPPAMALMALMRVYQKTKDEKLLTAMTTTFDALARGGIRDHLGGGFHRYATDQEWLIPHFEKMLYDNALLTIAFTEAYQLTKKEDYAKTASHTLDYVLRDLRLKGGGFASAEDADSEKTEGKFYVWHYDELVKILDSNELEALVSAYGVSAEGNFSTELHAAELEKAAGLKTIENANILAVELGKILPDTTSTPLASACAKLMNHRQQRERPLRDDKVLCGWNGLMIAALAKAGYVLGRSDFTEAAAACAGFIRENMRQPSGALWRRYCNGTVGVPAMLEDYSFLIAGLIELNQSTLERHWLDWAIELQELQENLFSDDSSGANQFYYDSQADDKTLIVRPRDLFDNATPSGHSVACLNLLRLGAMALRHDFREKAAVILRQNVASLTKFPRAFPFMLCALDFWLDGGSEIHWNKTAASKIAESKIEKENIRDFLRLNFAPSTTFVVDETQIKSASNSQFIFQLCSAGVCRLPTNDGKAILEALQSNSP